MSTTGLEELSLAIKGELLTDHLHKILYATDASVYRELPLGVAYPRDADDVVTIVKFCHQYSIPIIPRAGGTSLAGQCVGEGLVVDVSKYMVEVLEINEISKTVTVQPGVIRDELNYRLTSYGLMLGPNTSTANRAMVGGMVGNNSCGTTSIVFGNMRDHVVQLKAVLSDGSKAVFKKMSKSEFENKCKLNSLEGKVYRHLHNTLKNRKLQKKIKNEYPKPSIKRRNTGYALDAILNSNVFFEDKEDINVCKLICGSEGTLAFVTEIEVGLVDVPPPNEVLVALQFDNVFRSMEAIPQIMNYAPFACELMDKTILDCTKDQIMYRKDRFFLKGDPEAVLLVSFVDHEKEKALAKVKMLLDALLDAQVYFDYSIVEENIDRVWNLRKAGLGLLANLPGDKKAVACIEDTAVAIEDLSTYIQEFNKMMENFGQKSVYYAHAGAGEIHLRPLLDLKKEDDRELFFRISDASAQLVKKYRGSLSGEHGDGRVRAPFIKAQYGEEIYAVFCELKSIWDPKDILNPGKIVNAKPITEDLRFDEKHEEKSYDTVFDFSASGGVLRAAEKCNGSGDCRKLSFSGGTMCPSYMATRNEKDTTRARANTLREILTRPTSENAWDSSELKEVMDLCLSCKGCTSECPSNVDMSTMKAEFLHHFQKKNGIPLRSRIFSNFQQLNALGYRISTISNTFLKNTWTGSLLKKAMGVHPKRSLPLINKRSLRSIFSIKKNEYSHRPKVKKVYLFVDEFTNYNDATVGEKGLGLLFSLGYDVRIIEHAESGRAAISKGLLDKAVTLAHQNVSVFCDIVTEESPLIGFEPSAILTFKDEYPRLVSEEWKAKAAQLAENVFTIESFLHAEIQNGTITKDHFHTEEKSIKLHGHCHQKALTNIEEALWLLSIPENYVVEMIPSGCCGMAGSFGYEKEHYEVSMQIGELVLFPSIRQMKPTDVVVASGTSCRHQILDGTNIRAKHVVEVLFDALAV
ncbi:MAG: FAD-linked oxidase C-terminal domain-containing protein [Bacteroidota bacterium]